VIISVVVFILRLEIIEEMLTFLTKEKSIWLVSFDLLFEGGGSLLTVYVRIFGHFYEA
jgi:hypothetical protein